MLLSGQLPSRQGLAVDSRVVSGWGRMRESGRAKIAAQRIVDGLNRQARVHSSRQRVSDKASSRYRIARIEVGPVAVDVEPPIVHVEREAPDCVHRVR